MVEKHDLLSEGALIGSPRYLRVSWIPLLSWIILRFTDWSSPLGGPFKEQLIRTCNDLGKVQKGHRGRSASSAAGTYPSLPSQTLVEAASDSWRVQPSRSS